MTLVCPKCGRAFVESPGARAVCPAAGCGHSWAAEAAFEPTIAAPDDRKASHALRVTHAGGRTEDLVLTGTVTVGRSPEATLLVNDPGISRKHLAIEKRGESWYVKDLGSSSGTRVNGQPVVDAKLSPGDRIQVGETSLEYCLRFESAPAVEVRMGETVRGAAPGSRLVIGRDPGCEIVLPSPVVSRRHAAISREGSGWVIEDLGSAQGVFVNGQRVRRQALARGDRVRIGPFDLRHDGAELAPAGVPGGILLEASGVGKRAGTLDILKDVSIVVRPNEFVGLLGPSGAGKSTFMDTLNGFRPATSGRVLVNGEDLFAIFHDFKTNIGYVPQDDIIHRELTVREALYYTARMRLPEDTTEGEIDRLVAETIASLELTERRDTRIAALSGGQRKRVSVGVELLTKPPLLFLDEPTSGLDPGTEEKMMLLFRKLAEGGRTIVVTTHVMENVELLDQIVVLVKGRLAWFGPPKEALAHFGIPKITKIYDRLETKRPEEWAELYAASTAQRTYVAERRPDARPAAAPPAIPVARPATSAPAQFVGLARRYVATLLGEPRNMVSLLLPGPLIGFLMTLPWDASNPQHHRFFLVFMTVTAVFCGAFNSFREIVKEKAIFKRERMVNLQLVPYVLSKFAVLSAFFLVEMLLLLGIVCAIEDIDGSFAAHYVSLLLAAFASCGIGLIISSVVDSSEKAIGLLIVVIIPQIIFSGGITALEGVSKALGYLMVTFWSFDAMDVVASKAGAGTILADWSMLLVFLALYLGAAVVALRLQDVR